MSGINSTSLVRNSLLDYDTFIETDYTRYDLHISPHYLKKVERLFLCYFFADHSDYVSAMAMTLVTKGISDIGFEYSVKGTRCSGDAHTSIGNGLINHFNTWVCLQKLGTSWCSFHEGDDGIIGCYESNVDQVLFNLHMMPTLGFQLKLDKYTNIDDTSFCGRFLCGDRGNLDSVCDINRTLSKIHTICSDGHPRSLLLAKMMSYYFTDKATPIVGALSFVIINILLPKVSDRQLSRAVFHLRRDYWFAERFSESVFHGKKFPHVPPPPHLRALVFNRCGYTPEMQNRYEQYYTSWLSVGFIPDVVDRIPGDWVDREDGHVHGSYDTMMA